MTVTEGASAVLARQSGSDAVIPAKKRSRSIAPDPGSYRTQAEGIDTHENGGAASPPLGHPEPIQGNNMQTNASCVLASVLPETGFLRISDIVGRKTTKKTPEIRGVYPVSRSTWWAGVRSGRYPQPVRISERCSAWRVEDIRKLIESATSAKAAS